ncbi:MAG: cation-translocating P-type ATPase [Oligosphaeraceae bacterium]
MDDLSSPSPVKNPPLGLTPEEVLESRRRHGENVLLPPPREAWWRQLLRKFDDPIIRILVIAAFLAILTGQAVEAAGILVAIVLATVLALVNELQAEKEFDVLNQVNQDTPVKVIRREGIREISRREVVVGDLVVLDQGEEVPADLEILEAAGLMVDQSRLTGESVPVEKFPRGEGGESGRHEETYPSWMALKGTPVVQGHALGRVLAVGGETELGRTATAAAQTTADPTPLMRQLDHLAEQIGAVGMGASALTFLALVLHASLTGRMAQSAPQWAATLLLLAAGAIALCRIWMPSFYTGAAMLRLPWKRPRWLDAGGVRGWGIPLAAALLVLLLGGGILLATGLLPPAPSAWLSESAASHLLTFFMVSVALIVMAMPEGLPMSVTLALAYSMRRMVATNNLVRRMHACETIGAATVICTDKTGTLTRNQMQVQHMEYPAAGKALLQQAIAVNSTAELSFPEEAGGAPVPLGNPTEGALLLWLHQEGEDYHALRSAFRTTPQDQWPFTTERKYMATRGCPAQDPRTPWLFLKGAPEILLAHCTRLLTDQGERPLSPEDRPRLLQEIQTWQARGMRILGFAGRPNPDMSSPEEARVAEELLWMGFAAIADPVRPEVPLALAHCRQAGIQVKMVTGDSPETAREIGRQSRLWDDGHENQEGLLMTGAQFQALGEEEAIAAAARLRIMARARPNDKLRLVQCLRQQGEVVAVTGDGTNDAPALNRADVGIAMGKTGTAVAKEAADIILLDDSFPSIVQAVLWGRSLYRNLQKFLIFQLTVNLVALAIAILGPFLNLELPLTVIQVLWINLIMDTFAAIALATDPPDPALMRLPPRRQGDFMISRPMLRQILAAGLPCLAILVGALLYFRAQGMDIMDSWAETTPRSRTMLTEFFSLFVLLQFWNLFATKCWGVRDGILSHLWDNRPFLLISGIILLGQFLIVTFGGRVFRTVPLSRGEWLSVLGLSLCILPVHLLLGWWRRRRSQGEN